MKLTGGDSGYYFSQYFDDRLYLALKNVTFHGLGLQGPLFLEMDGPPPLYQRTVSPFCPSSPSTPGVPFTPGTPSVPFIPFKPGRPVDPGKPFLPGTPVRPVVPLSPIGPRLPGGPTTPPEERCSILRTYTLIGI